MWCRASVFLLFIACDRTAAPVVGVPQLADATTGVAPVDAAANLGSLSTGSLSTAPCVVNATEDSVARCPDPMAWSRGDGLGMSDSLPLVKATPLPPDLEASRSFACAYACATKGAAAHLLAWSIIEDSRPLRNHNAAFLVEDPMKIPKWSVVVMYRHATNTAWNIDVSMHSRSRPLVKFDDKPSWNLVAGVMREDRWQTQDEPDGFKILAGATLPAIAKLIETSP